MLLTTTLGEKVVSKGSAETLGSVDGVVIDAARHLITALQVGKGRKAKVVPWDAISGVGTAAVIVERDDALRDPDDEIEPRYTRGDVAVIGALTLSDLGNSLGTIVDLEYDSDTGSITAIRTSQSNEISGDRLRAAGTHAWIFAAGDEALGSAL